MSRQHFDTSATREIVLAKPTCQRLRNHASGNMGDLRDWMFRARSVRPLRQIERIAPRAAGSHVPARVVLAMSPKLADTNKVRAGAERLTP